METLGSKDAELLSGLREGKMVLTPTQGNSMRPFIHGGLDKVLVRKEEDVTVGDIVMVPYGGVIILHRVYAINGSRLILMGDGNLVGNEVVDKADVWGTAVEIIKPDGRRCKPKKAWLWRHALPFRRILLKLHRKWYRIRNKNGR